VTDPAPTPEQLDAAIPDLDWTTLPDGATASWFEAPSGRLATISMGDPGHPRVVLVPGVTGSKEDFSLMLPVLAAAGYHVLSYDMAGQYESASAGPATGHFTHELFVADLLAILEAGPAPVHVLGYSFAGTVSQIALAQRPDLFASLTLLSCPPQPGQGFRGVKRIGKISSLTTGRIGAALMIWGLHANVTKVPPGRQAFVDHRLTMTRRSSVADIIMLMKRSPDLRAVLRDSPLPKLIAVGEHDLWPTSLHHDFANSIDARFVSYPTGHSPCETTPHQLCRDLLELYRSA
jgi:pimeloyl-ACP methyl ester carboxylesterase